MQHIQIAIDGPSGAGKSTISKAIAARLGIVYVDTGALYRTVGYYARSQGISLPAIAAVVDKLSDIHVEVRYVDGVQNVFLNGENLGDRIRENEISLYASAVGALPRSSASRGKAASSWRTRYRHGHPARCAGQNLPDSLQRGARTSPRRRAGGEGYARGL